MGLERLLSACFRSDCKADVSKPLAAPRKDKDNGGLCTDAQDVTFFGRAPPGAPSATSASFAGPGLRDPVQPDQHVGGGDSSRSCPIPQPRSQLDQPTASDPDLTGLHLGRLLGEPSAESGAEDTPAARGCALAVVSFHELRSPNGEPRSTGTQLLIEDMDLALTASTAVQPEQQNRNPRAASDPSAYQPISSVFPPKPGNQHHPQQPPQQPPRLQHPSHPGVPPCQQQVQTAQELGEPSGTSPAAATAPAPAAAAAAAASTSDAASSERLLRPPAGALVATVSTPPGYAAASAASACSLASAPGPGTDVGLRRRRSSSLNFLQADLSGNTAGNTSSLTQLLSCSGGPAVGAGGAGGTNSGGGGVAAAAVATSACLGLAPVFTAPMGGDPRDIGVIRPSSLAELAGQLEWLRWLASGSSGRVYTGLWKGSPVAVKVMLSSTQDQMRESVKEALLSRVVSHPAICQCYTVCSEVVSHHHLQLPQPPAVHHSPSRSQRATSLLSPGASDPGGSVPSSPLFLTLMPRHGGSSSVRWSPSGLATKVPSQRSRPGAPCEGSDVAGAGAGSGSGGSSSFGFAGSGCGGGAGASTFSGVGSAVDGAWSSPGRSLERSTKGVGSPSTCLAREEAGAAAAVLGGPGAEAAAAGESLAGAAAAAGGWRPEAGSECQTANWLRPWHSERSGGGGGPQGGLLHRQVFRRLQGRGSGGGADGGEGRDGVEGQPPTPPARPAVLPCGGGSGRSRDRSPTPLNAHMASSHMTPELHPTACSYGFRSDSLAERPSPHLSPHPLPQPEPHRQPQPLSPRLHVSSRSPPSHPALETPGGTSRMAARAAAALLRQTHVGIGNQASAAGTQFWAESDAGRLSTCTCPQLPSSSSDPWGSPQAAAGAQERGVLPAWAAAAAAGTLNSSAAGREARRAVAAGGPGGGGGVELNTTLSLSELLRTHHPADDDSAAVAHSLAAVLLSMGAVPGKYCTVVVLEWCNQGTLQQAIRSRPFNPDRAPDNQVGLLALLRTALEIAQGMSYLHSLDIIHGDLKPSNVLLQSHAGSVGSSSIWAADLRGYVAKVADFGLSVPAHSSNSSVGPMLQGQDVDGGVSGAAAAVNNNDSSNWGALAYLAPEVPESGPSKKSDVYSYGCVLYSMCTGKQPFQGIRQGPLLVGLATGQLKLHWPDHVYKLLRRLGEACCSSNPRERPSFDKVVSALQKIITHVGSARSPGGSSSSRPSSRLAQDQTTASVSTSTFATTGLASTPGSICGSSFPAALGPARRSGFGGSATTGMSVEDASDAADDVTAAAAAAWQSAVAGCAQLSGLELFARLPMAPLPPLTGAVASPRAPAAPPPAAAGTGGSSRN